MLQLVRVDHDTALAALRGAGIDAFVGPTDERGWTAVQSDDASDTLVALGVPVVDYGWRFVPELDDELMTLTITAAGVATEIGWDVDEPQDGVVLGDPRLLATELVEHFGGSAESVAHLLATIPDVNDLIEDLSELLTLPELSVQPPERAVVAVRSREEAVTMAAAIAGPSLVVDVGEGWWVVAVAEGGGPRGVATWQRTDALTHALAETVSRNDPVLHLGRTGEERTMFVASRRAGTGVIAWASRWEATVDESSEQYTGLARVLGEPEVPSHARALLRRRSDRHGMADLLAMFGVPAGVLDVFEGVEGTPAPRRVERTGWSRAAWSSVRDEVRTGVREDWRVDRERSVRFAWVTVVVLALGLLIEGTLAIFSLAVVLSGGALVDEESVSGSDIAFVPFAFALTALFVALLWRAAKQLAAARRRAHSPSD